MNKFMTFNDFLKSKLNEDVGAVAADSTSNVNVTGNNIATDEPVGRAGPVLKRDRLRMPQIKSELYNEFVSDLTLNEIKIKEEVLIAKSKLVPSQNELNTDKVNSLKSTKISGTKLKPILVSNDNVVVDGHHRWAAYDDNEDVISNLIDMKFDDLYEFLQNKPYVINEK